MALIHMFKVLVPNVFSRCDERDIYTGKQKPANVPQSGYAHATKIRAAISHYFARERGLGRQPWIDTGDGTATGNPSLAPSLATYMISLQRRKVQLNSCSTCHAIRQLMRSCFDWQQACAGEVVTSARAITQEIMKRIFDFNEAFCVAHPPHTTSKRDTSNWGNSNTRQMLQFLYVVSFWCLLRYDEALNIEFHQIEMAQGDDGITFLKISLPFRKTHQFGGECFKTLQLGHVT